MNNWNWNNRSNTIVIRNRVNTSCFIYVESLYEIWGCLSPKNNCLLYLLYLLIWIELIKCVLPLFPTLCYNWYANPTNVAIIKPKLKHENQSSSIGKLVCFCDLSYFCLQWPMLEGWMDSEFLSKALHQMEHMGQGDAILC